MSSLKSGKNLLKSVMFYILILSSITYFAYFSLGCTPIMHLTTIFSSVWCKGNLRGSIFK